MHRREFVKRAALFGAGSGAAISAWLRMSAQTLMAGSSQDVPTWYSRPAPARGPLKVHPTNPRYFTDGSGQAIFLTGSHTWANFQDIGVVPLPRFNWPAYLEMMVRHNHNFMRFWHCLQAAYAPWTDGKMLVDPLPYLRTGPGTALDG